MALVIFLLSLLGFWLISNPKDYIVYVFSFWVFSPIPIAFLQFFLFLFFDCIPIVIFAVRQEHVCLYQINTNSSGGCPCIMAWKAHRSAYAAFDKYSAKGSNDVSPSSGIVTLSSSNIVLQSWNTWCIFLSGIVFACGFFHGRLLFSVRGMMYTVSLIKRKLEN